MAVKKNWQPHIRGALYEADEERPSLLTRPDSTGWTLMEAGIFNVVSQYWDRSPGAPLFSTRLKMVDAILAVFDELQDGS